MSRQDQYDVTVTVTAADGETRTLGTFDTLSGGGVTAEDSKYRPGGMADEITLGSYSSTDDVTISRLLDLSRDLETLRWLLQRVGSATVVASKQSLDVNKNKFGKPLVYRGKLKGCTPPEHDSTSTDPALYEIVVEVAGKPS